MTRPRSHTLTCPISPICRNIPWTVFASWWLVVHENSDGTYTATLTSPNVVGVDSVTATLNGSLLASSAPVTYTPAPATHLGLVPSGTSQTAGSPIVL